MTRRLSLFGLAAAILAATFAVLLGPAAEERPARLVAQEASADALGERLFVAKGCSTCHGAEGRGGVGPVLARTDLGFEEVRAQLRSPRGLMPRFPEGVVSEEEVRAILEYVRSLPEPSDSEVVAAGCRGHGGRHGVGGAGDRGRHGAARAGVRGRHGAEHAGGRGRHGPGHLPRHGPGPHGPGPDGWCRGG